MTRWWLAVGPKENWDTSFSLGNIWGLKDSGRPSVMWSSLTAEDRLLFYVTKIGDVVGFGTIRRKFRQDRPLWPDEVQTNAVRWPLRFEFDIDYLLPSDKWEESKISSQDLSLLARGGFQIVAEPMAIEVVRGFGITDVGPRSTRTGLTTHDELVEALVEAGRIQRYVAEKEYKIDGERLDAVWKRVERSVPTFAFEVQVSGDLYHAIGKLKHAYDIWNSRISWLPPIASGPRYKHC